MPDVKELWRQSGDVQERLQAFLSRIDGMVEEYRRDLMKRYAVEHGQLLKEKRKIDRELEEIQRSAEMAAIEESSKDSRVGTKWQFWKNSYGRWYVQDTQAVVEVLTHELQVECRKVGFGSPCIGNLVLRHLKKDGTVGKRIECFPSFSDWYPLGEHPENLKTE